MSDTRKVVIEIDLKKETDAIDNKTVENENDTAQGKTQGQLVKSILVNEGFKLLKQTANRILETSVGRYFTMTEDYIGEQSYQNAKTLISKGTSLITSVGAGFALGGGFTPAGVVGGVIGAITWGVNEGFAVYERKSNYAQSLNASRFNTQFMGTRTGLIDNGRGTEN
jgi:hypothetical protein